MPHRVQVTSPVLTVSGLPGPGAGPYQHKGEEESSTVHHTTPGGAIRTEHAGVQPSTASVQPSTASITCRGVPASGTVKGGGHGAIPSFPSGKTLSGEASKSPLEPFTNTDAWNRPMEAHGRRHPEAWHLSSEGLHRGPTGASGEPSACFQVALHEAQGVFSAKSYKLHLGGGKKSHTFG